MNNSFNKIVNSLGRLNVDTVSEILYGKIITLDPLSIKINDRDVLPEKFFVLGQMCRPHKATIPHKHEYNGVTEIASLHTHEINNQITNNVHMGNNNEEFVVLEIYPKLEIGDTVLLFSFNGGQKYYVAERIIV